MHYASFRWLVLIIIAAAVAAIGTGALANWHLEGGLELWLVVLVACVLPTGILAGVFNYCWESWVSQLNRSRLESESLAWTDHLTDLPDRLAFVRSADAELVKPGTGSLAVLVIDLDDFKSLNDLVGHHAGEAMLISLGHLIRRTINQATDGCGIVAQIGGEQFAALVGPMFSDKVLALAENLCAVARQSAITCHERQIRVTLSVGVCFVCRQPRLTPP